MAREVTAARGAERFEPVRGNEHTHHLHCDGCGRVTTAPVCGVDDTISARILRDYGFAVTDHTLTFHGRCAECRGAAARLPTSRSPGTSDRCTRPATSPS